MIYRSNTTRASFWVLLSFTTLLLVQPIVESVGEAESIFVLVLAWLMISSVVCIPLMLAALFNRRKKIIIESDKIVYKTWFKKTEIPFDQIASATLTSRYDTSSAITNYRRSKTNVFRLLDQKQKTLLTYDHNRFTKSKASLALFESLSRKGLECSYINNTDDRPFVDFVELSERNGYCRFITKKEKQYLDEAAYLEEA